MNNGIKMNRSSLVDKNTVWWKRWLLWVLFLGYLAGLSYFLFFSEHYGRTDGNGEYRYNLVMFQEIKRFIRYYKEVGIASSLINLVGNVVAFVPFGFGLPLMKPNGYRFFKVLFWTFALSITIETIQLGYKIGCFDVDDLLLNTIGGMLGYLSYRIVMLLFFPKQRRQILREVKRTYVGGHMFRKRTSYKFMGRSHSRNGVVSMLIGLACITTFLSLVIISGVQLGVGSMLLGVIGMVAFVISIFGFILGVKSFQEKDIYYVAPVVGLGSNGIIMITLFCLYIVGVVS